MKVFLHTFKGKRWLVSEFAHITGISAPTINARIAAGWTVEQAIGTPTPKQRRAGVVSNLPAFEGTGAGSVLQENPETAFQKEAAE